MQPMDAWRVPSLMLRGLSLLYSCSVTRPYTHARPCLPPGVSLSSCSVTRDPACPLMLRHASPLGSEASFLLSFLLCLARSFYPSLSGEMGRHFQSRLLRSRNLRLQIQQLQSCWEEDWNGRVKRVWSLHGACSMRSVPRRQAVQSCHASGP